jgi:hypothetical protein
MTMSVVPVDCSTTPASAPRLLRSIGWLTRALAGCACVVDGAVHRGTWHTGSLIWRIAPAEGRKLDRVRAVLGRITNQR